MSGHPYRPLPDPPTRPRREPWYALKATEAGRFFRVLAVGQTSVFVGTLIVGLWPWVASSAFLIPFYWWCSVRAERRALVEAEIRARQLADARTQGLLL